MDRPLDALPEGTKLAGYVVGRVLGRGGFGITYLAADALYPEVKAAIKEFLPGGLAMRQAGALSVHPTSPDRTEPFKRALASFEKEARTLVALRHPNVVEVQRYIELNGTAYVVMKYEEGRSLATILAGGKTLSEAEVMDILPPLLDGLEAVHAKRFVHRDLKPGNIYRRTADGSPVLLDFGAARQAIGEERKTSLSEIYTPGYAPLEQYDRHAEQGPFTDIYALGATLYRCITGETPPEAITRHNALRRGSADPLVPLEKAAKGRHPSALAEAVQCSLALEERERPQTIAQLRELLGLQPASRQPASGRGPTLVAGGPHPSQPISPPQPARRKRTLAYAAVAGLLLAAAAAAAVMVGGDGGRRETDAGATRAAADEAKRRADEAWKETKRRAAADAEARRLEEERARDEARRREEAERRRIEGEIKRHLAEAERALGAQDWAAAERALAEAKRLKPDHAEVAALEAKLKAAKEATSRLVPGRVFRDCPDCPEMVVIPAGTFTMGSPEGETGRESDEGPQHRMTIAKPFALGKYEVTRGEWATFVRETNHRSAGQCYGWNEAKKTTEQSPTADYRNPGFAQTDRHPAVCVSWEDAKAYTAWLSRKTGKTYRLPSEAEWEYAARAGTQTSRPWGDDPDAGCRQANGADASLKKKLPNWTTTQCDDGHIYTAPVGSFQANRFGLHDLIGNVWEWVEDCWNGSYSGAPSDGRAWLSGECSRRVLRGGSWYSDPGYLRSANRSPYVTGNRLNNLGFRLARTLD